MKKLLGLLLAFIMVGASGLSYAANQRTVPRAQNNEPIAHPLYGGYSYFRWATAAERVVCTSRCLLAGLWMSSGANTNALFIRDTGLDTASGTYAIGPIRFRAETAYPQPLIPLPMLFENGISLDMENIIQGESVTIMYLDLD